MNSKEGLSQLYSAIQGAGSILFTGPMDPDGDSIGACLALCRAAEGFSKATLHVAGEANYRYAWMPHANTLLSDSQLLAHYDLVVVMDGDRTRLTKTVTALFESAETTALDMAAHLYTGIIFDTGGFKHENTQPETHRLAAELLDLGVSPAPIHAKVLHERTSGGLRLLGEVLGAAQFFAEGEVVVGVVTEEAVRRLSIASGDTEGIVDALLNTAGVEVAVLVRQVGKSVVKLSLRSKTRVNVARIARQLNDGGGGHVRAAGCRIPCSLDELMQTLPAVLSEAV